MTDDVVDRLHFNTAIAAVMELVTGIADAAGTRATRRCCAKPSTRPLRLLAPFVPHVASELWEVAGHADGARRRARWPIADATALVRDADRAAGAGERQGARPRRRSPADAREDEIVAAALADAQVQAHVAGRPVRKQVVVPGRMVSLVV